MNWHTEPILFPFWGDQAVVFSVEEPINKERVGKVTRVNTRTITEERTLRELWMSAV